MTPAGRPHRRHDPGVMSSLASALTEVRRPGPFELGWRWRWEFAIVAGLAGLTAFITSTAGLIGLSVAAGAGLAAGTALLCLPPARQWAIALAWCLITPHRVLAGCANAWVQTRSGKLPVILATTPAAYGERVQIWLRAGITAADLTAASDVLAAACWAAEVRVVPGIRHAHLVTLEVIRNIQEERVRPTPQSWPYSRRVEGPPLRLGAGFLGRAFAELDRADQELGDVDHLEALLRLAGGFLGVDRVAEHDHAVGQAVETTSGSSARASSMRSSLILLPVRSSSHMRAPPAPQQKPWPLQRCISSAVVPGTASMICRGGV